MPPLDLRWYDDGPSWLRAAGPWLATEEAAHNLLLGNAPAVTAAQVHASPPAALVTAHRDDVLVLAALHVPPRGLVLSRCDDQDAVAQLARALSPRAIPWVSGPDRAVRAFADAWSLDAPSAPRRLMQQRIFQLTRVRPPRDPGGRLRPADAGDLDLVTAWSERFAEDAGLPPSERGPHPDEAARRIESQGVFFWEHHGAAAMAMSLRRTARGAGVTGVYTPPERRRRGYGAAVVAALSERLLAGGSAFCFLYTDRANPTSNGIYTALGYEPVTDVELWSLSG